MNPLPSPSKTRRNLAEDITAELRQAIVSGQIRPGTPLAEPVLAAQFKASRAPIREALIALEREGLVEFNERSRTRVCTLTPSDFQEICTMRVALESTAARLAAERWTPANTAAIEENLRRQEAAITLGELSHIDVEMHETIVRLSGHRRLIKAWLGIRWQFEMCLAYTHRLQQKLAFDSRRITVDSHRRLLAALASGKPKLAEQTMAGHIEASLEWSLAEFPQEERPLANKRNTSAWPVRALGEVATIVTVLLAGVWSARAEAPAQGTEFFQTKVRPLLAERCYECHSHERKIKGGLVLDSRSGWEKGGDTGPALVPGKPGESLLIKAIGHEDKDLAMPPKKKLSDDEIAVLTEWVKMGAPDPRVAVAAGGANLTEALKHWAFRPVTDPQPLPSVFPEKSAKPIDAFLFAAMAKQGLQPAPRADRVTLLRRATYDLTGLPPTARETAAFIADPQADESAFAQVVDRLLASPAYGEKWGRYWLDLAHYADTTGCSADWPIDDLWRYRDWVIQAFNEDKPFDRFLTEQLAGDLLAADLLKRPGAIDDRGWRADLVATGFLATAKRFGSDPGSYENLTIGDTLDTTWKALQGLTLGCARCHDHKFDPVSSQDYYALYGIFASSLYPYAGAEKNRTPMLVPLASPTNPSGAVWDFEDNETSEDVADRAPLSPWNCRGGVAVRVGNSPITQWQPKGAKLVEFQATAPQGEMARRVRWEQESSAVRDLAVDFQLAPLWNETGDGLKLLWRPQGNVAEEVELAKITGSALVAPRMARPTPLLREHWHHLTLSYDTASATLALRIWDESGHLVADWHGLSAKAAKLRETGDLVVRFEAGAVTDKRQACVRLDNLTASSTPQPSPQQSRSETAFAMWEGTPHDVAIQKRGESTSPGIVVPRRNVALFGGQPVEHPRLESGRRDLAGWLLDERNPLTLRVFVNRLWQWHFGRGIVATPNDFGHQGEPPTHPELLDYLVRQFRAKGLSVKAMHREIMLSYAYAQASAPQAGSGERDPDNRWLAHFSPRRLTAEEVRDSVLFVSGSLDRAGAGYRQPFPPFAGREWSQHSPFSQNYEAQYATYEHRKRSIYLPVVRLVADPFLSTFDGADSNQSVASRGETAVPLQALALLNAPFITTAANTLAGLALNQTSNAEAVTFLQRSIFGADLSERTQRLLTARLATLTAEKGLPRDEALAVLAQSLLASNAFLYVF